MRWGGRPLDRRSRVAGIEIPDVQTAQGMRFAAQANTTLEEIVADVIRPDRRPLR